MTICFFCFFRFDVMLQCIICDKSLQFTDGNRLSFNSTDTLTFTLRFLWAYTSANCRKRRGFSNYFIGFFDISFFYFFDKCWNIDRDWTALNTFCIFTINTSCRFFHRFFLIVSKTHFLKIRCTYLRILFSYRYFF